MYPFINHNQNDVISKTFWKNLHTLFYTLDIFKKHIVKFLEKHIRSWDKKYAFNGEEEVLEFFNDVLENGQVVNK